MATKYTSIFDLPRNDVPAALELFRYLKAKGEWDADTAQSLIMLQDDPDELLAAMEAEEE